MATPWLTDDPDCATDANCATGNQFRRGDVNGDAALNIADAIALLGFLFSGSAAPGCLDAGDVNDDGANNIADAISLLGFLFSGSAETSGSGDQLRSGSDRHRSSRLSKPHWRLLISG